MRRLGAPRKQDNEDYSTVIVPFSPSPSTDERGSLLTRFVTKAYRPGENEQAVAYLPGGIVIVGWLVGPLTKKGHRSVGPVPEFRSESRVTWQRTSSARSLGSVKTTSIASEE